MTHPEYNCEDCGSLHTPWSLQAGTPDYCQAPDCQDRPRVVVDLRHLETPRPRLFLCHSHVVELAGVELETCCDDMPGLEAGVR